MNVVPLRPKKTNDLDWAREELEARNKENMKLWQKLADNAEAVETLHSLLREYGDDAA